MAAIDLSTFTPSVDFVTGGAPFQAISADIDGDGKPEIITSNLGDSTVSVLRNLGSAGLITSGSFDLAVTFPVSAGPTGIAAGDIDGDGKIDLVTANFSANSITVLRNISVSGTINSGSFAPGVDFACGVNPAYVVIADVDGDGKLDISVVNQGGASVSILRNLSIPGTIGATSLATSIDIPVTGAPLGLAVGDLDGDGKVELISADISGSTISVVRNKSIPGAITFDPRVDYASGTGPINVALGDVDRDGKRDIVVANQNGNSVSILRNATLAVGAFTATSFEPAVQLVTLATPRRVELIDVDLNGSLDIVLSEFGNNAISIFANVSTPGQISAASFLPSVDFTVGVGPYVMGSGDLDGDGDTDLFAPDISANTVSVLQNQSAASIPVIAESPLSQSVVVGDAVTFSVNAAGSSPLSYQWRKNGVNIAGATGRKLVLTNVQVSQAGAYSVKITNPLGSATSADALLTVSLGPTVLSVGVGAVSTGQRVKVPVVANFNGSENALGFSLAFDATQLRYVTSEPGRGSPSNMAFDINTNSTPTGALGVGLALPAGLTFAARTQAVVVVTFEANATANSGSVPIQFSDAPIGRQIVDKTSRVISSRFSDGSITVLSVGFEGDVNPTPAGDQKVQITDWVQVGRFVAGLDIPPSGTIYQRADSAPRSSRGNGQLTVADWVQAGRYATGLDPLTASAGPTRYSPPPPQPGSSGANNSSRVLKIGDVNVVPGESVDVPIILVAKGDENAFGFSLKFNPALLEFIEVKQGSGASGSWLNINTSQAVEGVVGVALALPLGEPALVAPQTLVLVRFRAKMGQTGSSLLSFGDEPTVKEIVDIYADSLEAAFKDGQVSVGVASGPVLWIVKLPSSVLLSWASIGSDGYLLETSSDLGAGHWTASAARSQDADGIHYVTLEKPAAAAYFRLRHP